MDHGSCWDKGDIGQTEVRKQTQVRQVRQVRQLRQLRQVRQIRQLTCKSLQDDSSDHGSCSDKDDIRQMHERQVRQLR